MAVNYDFANSLNFCSKNANLQYFEFFLNMMHCSSDVRCLMKSVILPSVSNGLATVTT